MSSSLFRNGFFRELVKEGKERKIRAIVSTNKSVLGRELPVKRVSVGWTIFPSLEMKVGRSGANRGKKTGWCIYWTGIESFMGGYFQ